MAAVIYEVNVDVDADIATEYENWLRPHIQEIIHFEGFLSANFFVRKPEDEGKPKDDKAHFTVQYHLDSRENLQKYFDNHAQKMRQDGLNRFGTKFTAFRRILTQKESFTRK